MSAIVKICGITSPADALAAAGAGADALGLMFYEKSPRHVPLKTAAEIARLLPPFVIKVGVFVNAPEELVLRAIGECDLNLLQFHGDESPEYCRLFPVMTIKAFRIKDAGSLKPLTDYKTDAWLLDAHCARPTRRHRRGFQLGSRRRSAKTRPAHLSRGRLDPGKRGRRHPPRSSLCRGCFQRRRGLARQEGPRQSARVYNSRQIRLTAPCGTSSIRDRQNHHCHAPRFGLN